jgi:hypothetical protein
MHALDWFQLQIITKNLDNVICKYGIFMSTPLDKYDIYVHSIFVWVSVKYVIYEYSRE